MELNDKDKYDPWDTLEPCDRGQHQFIPIGDGQKREDAASNTVGTIAFCVKCTNTVFVVVATKSKLTP